MIDQMRKNYPISELCDAFSVSRSSYYAAKSGEPGPRARENALLINEMKTIHSDRHTKVYGSPRMTAELKARGLACSENRIARLMAGEGLRATRKAAFRPRTTVNDPHRSPSPNLLAGIGEPTTPGEVLVSDITYVATREGWLYLAVVMDVFSRSVIGWELAAHLRTDLVTTALSRAVLEMPPEPNSIFHSDRGCQYTSGDLRSILRTLQLEQSMSAKGCCYDNARNESFFASLKREAFPEGCCFETRAEARLAIFDYLETFYNRRRRHSSLGNIAPAEFLAQYANKENKTFKNNCLITKRNMLN